MIQIQCISVVRQQNYANGGVAISQDNGVAPAVSGEFGDLSGESFTYTNGPFVGQVEFSIYNDQDSAYLAF